MYDRVVIARIVVLAKLIADIIQAGLIEIATRIEENGPVVVGRRRGNDGSVGTAIDV